MSGLDLKGKARVVKVESRKEGSGEKKELVLAVHLRVTTDAGVLAYFDPALRSLLFDQDTGEPRIQNLKPLALSGRQRNMALDIDGIKGLPVELHKFVIDAIPIDRVGLSFIATAFPQPAQKSPLLDTLGEEVSINIRPENDLLGGATISHRTSAPKQDAKPDATARANGVLPLEDAPQGGWPALKKGGEYDATTAEIAKFEVGMTVCHVSLLHVGSNAWVNGILLQLPLESEYREPPQRMEQPYESRGVAAMDAARFITGECDAWIARHKKNSRAAEINRLRSWAADLALQVKSKSEPAPPAAKKPKAKPGAKGAK